MWARDNDVEDNAYKHGRYRTGNLQTPEALDGESRQWGSAVLRDTLNEQIEHDAGAIERNTAVVRMDDGRAKCWFVAPRTDSPWTERNGIDEKQARETNCHWKWLEGERKSKEGQSKRCRWQWCDGRKIDCVVKAKFINCVTGWDSFQDANI